MGHARFCSKNIWRSALHRHRVLLFGMTGFGNAALNGLLQSDMVHLCGLFTVKKPKDSFPYYTCPKIHDIANANNIPVFEGFKVKDESTVRLIQDLKPEIIIVSSFNQIIPEAVISIPKYGVINIHPSLLPKYRGPTPVEWVLLKGEKETGVTIHLIDTAEIDKGHIIVQERINIEPEDTNGSLRCKLSHMVEPLLEKALIRALSAENKSFVPQNDLDATYYPKISTQNLQINLDWCYQEMAVFMRALSPYPGCRLLFDGKEHVVIGMEKYDPVDDIGETRKKDFIIAPALDCMVRFKTLPVRL